MKIHKNIWTKTSGQLSNTTHLITTKDIITNVVSELKRNIIFNFMCKSLFAYRNLIIHENALLKLIYLTRNQDK